MSVKFKHGSPIMVDYTPSANVSAGDVIVIGDGVRIAHTDIEAGRLGALAIANGVYAAPKATGASSGISAGSIVYWDAVDKVAVVDDDDGANKLLGQVITTAEDSDDFVTVLHLQPVPSPGTSDASSTVTTTATTIE